MNKIVAMASPSAGDIGRGVSAPQLVPATPYEFFIAEKDRIHQQLLTAGIDDDWAIETAIAVAMEKTTAKLSPDDYEFCNHVYGAP